MPGEVKFYDFCDLTYRLVHTAPELAFITNYLRTFSRLKEHSWPANWAACWFSTVLAKKELPSL